MQAAQRAAAQVVRRVLGGATLPSALAAVRVESARPGLLHELAYGTLRFRGTLEAIVRQLAHAAPEPLVDALLCVALYQLMHTRAAPHAVVDQAVRATTALGRSSARGYVNALLRRFLRQRESLLQGAASTDEGRYSYPGWWVREVRAGYPTAFDAILDAANLRPVLTLRINRRAVSRDDYRQALAALGIQGFACGEQGLTLPDAGDVRALPGYADGWFSVQDAGAQLAAPLLGAQDGMQVLDACAAPGGKTTHLAELVDADVTALDIDPVRLARVGENLERLGLSARLEAADAADVPRWWDGRPFDRILLDAPCSASGVVRRHPDIKWLRREDDLAGFAQQQDRLLNALWPCLAPGGVLLYATCSVFAVENRARVDAFLAVHDDARERSVIFPQGFAHTGGQLLPVAGEPAHNHDGFFYALLAKS